MFIPAATIEREKLIDEIRELDNKMKGSFGVLLVDMLEEQIEVMKKLVDLRFRYTV